jgi:hypothetical protein
VQAMNAEIKNGEVQQAVCFIVQYHGSLTGIKNTEVQQAGIN